MGAWVVVLVPDGLLTAATGPVVLADADGQPFATRTAAERVSARYTHGAYVAQLQRGA